MEIISIGEKLEIPSETLVTIIAGNMRFNISCTPVNLEELAMGFLISEGLVENSEIEINVQDRLIEVLTPVKPTDEFRLRTSGSPGVFRVAEKLPELKPVEKFTIKECRDSLKYLDTEEYRKTRGYHTAAIVGKKGVVCKAYDVGRHNAIDKVVGMGVKEKVDFSRVFLLVSGRISQGMVAKCVRCRIPLLVSKAAILDSAIDKCFETGLSAVSFATGIAVKGEALTV
ncbi:MAG TPA: formate dehydrogenase accessory sulfurtransferase FdhD [Archaeoglobaceae archaeon]|nr:formate dehydrogenase accessory sulfurtransferase FdhD [Archaeoglobaceae archaeon]